jgi:secreted trypsin-like serine protease
VSFRRIHKEEKRFFCLGVYTRISVYRDWINETISRNTMNSDSQLFNMPNNIDMSNDLDIWWDRDVESKVEDNLRMKIYLLVVCLLIVMMKIKCQ